MPNASLPIPHFKQTAGNTCVPAFVRMVLAYLQHSIDEPTLVKLLDTKPFGTAVRNIQRVSSLGFVVSFGSSALTSIRAALASGNPVIAFVMTGHLKYWQVNVAHAVVVVGIDDENVYLDDPWIDASPQVSPIDDFLAAWAEFDHLAATIIR